MGIIKLHLAQMKAEDPAEYKRLMQVYGSERELLREVLGLTNSAVDEYNKGKVGS